MRKLTLIPIGGLANRFYAITSAIAFCMDYNIKLRIIWFKDKGMGADFHSLFELSEDVDKSNVEVIDAKWYHYIYDRPRKRNLWFSKFLQSFLFDKCLYEKDIKCSNTILNNVRNNSYVIAWFPFYPRKTNLKFLRPIPSIQRMIDMTLLKVGKDVVGIHIRRTDNSLSISNSPTSLFIEKMKFEISQDQNVRFYVASDSVEVKNELADYFEQRMISLDVNMERSSEAGIIDALVELYILSSTKKIYGSYASTYSTLAGELGGKKIAILSM